MQAGLLLIALGFGYKIFSEASASAKKTLKNLGRLVGVYIMVASFLGSLCVISCAIKSGGNYPFAGRGWKSGMKMCPIGNQTSALQSNATR